MYGKMIENKSEECSKVELGDLVYEGDRITFGGLRIISTDMNTNKYRATTIDGHIKEKI